MTTNRTSTTGGSGAPDPRLRSALALHRQGRSAAALQLLQRLPAEVMGPSGRRLLISTALAAGDSPLALEKARALAAETGTWDDRHLLANILAANGDLPTAQDTFEDLLAEGDRNGQARLGLARVLRDTGKPNLAIETYRSCLASGHDSPEIRRELARMLATQGAAEDALPFLADLLTSHPDDPDLLRLTAVAWERCDQPDAAFNAWRELARLSLDDCVAYERAADTGRAAHLLEEARTLLLEGLARLPDADTLISRLCLINIESHRYDDAQALVDTLQKKGAMRPHDWNNLGLAYETAGQIDKAVECLRKALEIDPAYRGAASNLLFALNYASSVPPEALYEEHAAWGRRFAPAHPAPIHRNRRDPDKRLRIGYVSADFIGHVVSYFLRPLLENHSEAVEVYAYSNVAPQYEDHFTRIFQDAVDYWRPIHGVSDADVADQIMADGIDILVDLAGHTSGNRLPVFGFRPAPVQATWLGYPNSTGVAAIDYRITDIVADPPGAEAVHTERLWRLPDSFLAYKPNTNMPVADPAPFLRHGAVTFGCFNKLNKVTPDTLHAWGRILSRVPESRLLLKAAGLSASKAREWVVGIMAEHGIPESRLDLRHLAASYNQHAAMYQEMDISLDPYPYSGTTTTCEALWAGVPVVTRAGNRHASRVSASILTNIGLPELIAEDAASYEDVAVALASDPDRLASLHATLRQRMLEAPLLDGARFARAMEAAYRGMWEAWCAEAPQEAD